MTRSTPRADPGWIAAALLALAAVAAYHGSFSGPFIFDDVLSIPGNPTLRSLGRALAPPAGGLTVSGRPLLNLSLAINYAINGTRVGGYHAVNLAIHLLAALTLFGVVRRTPWRPAPGPAGTARLNPTWFAFAVAALWLLHPLQTESVTYVIQRAESLMGLCYLLTLYGFIRQAEAATPAGRRGWSVLCVLSCLAGMACKEVMVSAPIVIFLYDRTFLSGSFRAAWRRHGRLHAALAATWLLLAALALASGNRGGTAGLGVGVAWWTYAETQFRAILVYLRLALWPHPLVFDYGAVWSRGWAEVAPAALAVAVLTAGAAWALWRRPALGFLGAWFFLILAPTSLVTGTRQTIAEHRMYLPLAAIAVLAVLGVERVAGRASLAACVALAVALGAATVRRNEDYSSKVSLYRDEVARQPANPWGHYNLGVALKEAHAPDEAERCYREALRLDPDFPEARNNLGDLLLQSGRLPEALDQYAAAVRLRPAYVEARYNYGLTLIRAGRPAAAEEQEEKALLLRPDFAPAHCALGLALAGEGLSAEALAQYGIARRLQPDFAPAHYNEANLLARLGRLPEAVEQYEAALAADPSLAEAEDNLGNALAREGRLVAALAHYQAAERLQPGNPGVHFNLGNAQLQLGHRAEAAGEYLAALRLQPDFAAARAALDRLREGAAAARTP